MEIKAKVLSSLRWTAGLRLCNQLATWAITLYVIRLLSPSDYGLMAMATVVLSFFGMFNQVIIIAIIQKPILEKHDVQKIFALTILINSAFFILSYLFAPIIASIFQETKLQLVIYALSLQFVINIFSTLPWALLRKEMRFKVLSVIGLCSSLTGSILTLIFAKLGYGVWALVYGVLGFNVVKTILFNSFSPMLPVPRFAFSGMHSFFSFSRNVVLSQILRYVYLNVDTVLIGKLLNKTSLGFYNVAMHIASLPMEKISGLISQVALPAYAKIQSDHRLAGKYFIKSVHIMALCSFPVFWGISSIASPAIPLILGEKWRISSILVQILCFMFPFQMIHNLIAPAMFGFGRSDITLKNSLTFVLIVPAALALGCLWKLQGVAAAWGIAYPICFFLNMNRALLFFHLPRIELITSLLKPFIGTTCMYLAVFGVKLFFSGNIHDIVLLFIMIGVGVCIYLSFMLIIDRSGCTLMRNLIKI